ncbi:MAG: hypothetical protein JW940_27365 [Polyangiaceae bacterium]|nr:hypothetical protein [Polyangiaceae bacterium]
MAALLVSARAAASPATFVVEITPEVESVVDSRFTRRLVQLELSELEVPPSPTVRNQPTALFFRVVRLDESTLRVELWERGNFYGARSISTLTGKAQLHARRIALAAAELARRLRRDRLAEAARLRRQARAAASAASSEALRSKTPRLVVAPSFGASLVGPDDLWLAGPSLSASVHAGAAYIDLGASWWTGRTRADAARSWVQWSELSLAPGASLELSPALGLDAGLVAAAAMVRLGRVQTVDAIANQKETYSARLAARAALTLSLSPSTSLALAPEAGAVLRHVPVTLLDGTSKRYGGLWLGVGFAAQIEP